jgi:hypothetical protein
MAIQLRMLLAFFRWKYTQDIIFTADLTALWFDKFQMSLREEGKEGLFGSQAKVEAVLSNLDPYSDPRYFRRDSKGVYLNTTAIAEDAGFDDAGQFSRETHGIISEFGARHGFDKWTGVCGVTPDSDVRSGRREFDEKKLSPAQSSLYLQVWEKLWLLREYMPHDPLAFRPFSRKERPYQIAKGFSGSRKARRIPTAPADQACFLIDRSIRWVAYYSEDLFEFRACLELNLAKLMEKKPRKPTGFLKKRFKKAFELTSAAFTPKHCGPSSPWPLSTFRGSNNKDRTTSVSLDRALFQLLPTACAIVIAAFSARRAQEILSLKNGCVHGPSGEYELDVWIEKTLRHHDRIPVPNVVHKAVSVLEYLSSLADHTAITPWLFEFGDKIPNEQGQHKRIGYKLDLGLVTFAQFIQVPRLANGSHWHFTPHQFRRFFAVTYFHRFRYPHLTALSDFLRHNDPDMTRRYITEAASGAFLRMNEEKRVAQKSKAERRQQDGRRQVLKEFQNTSLEFRIERLRAVHDGQEKMTGFGGVWLTKELQKRVENLTRQIKITSGAEKSGHLTLDQVISEFAKSISLEPNGLGHSYCKCTSTEADRSAAECIKQSKVSDTVVSSSLYAPDQRFAADTICSRCPHNVQLLENESYWRDMIRSSEAMANCALSTPLKELALRRKAIAEEHCIRCFDSGTDQRVGGEPN